MEPLYIYGDRYPKIWKMILIIIGIVTLPIPLTYWLFDMMLRFQSPIPFSFWIGYILFFCVLTLLACLNISKGIYLFYNNYMLYKNRLSLKDKIALAFMKQDISKLELFLNKINYVTIESLTIECSDLQYMRSSESGIQIAFILKYTDGKKQKFNSFVGLKEDYLNFLKPFMQYHILIYDPDNLIEAFQQTDKRILDYIRFKETYKESTNNN